MTTPVWYIETPTGLVFREETKPPTFETFEQNFGEATNEHASKQWKIGDLYLYGEQHYGEDAAQVIDSRKVSRRRVQTFAWVCRKFSGKRREARRGALSFYHHEAVAGLIDDPDHPELTDKGLYLLELAEALSYSVEDVEEEVRKLRGKGAAEPDLLAMLQAALNATLSVYEIAPEGDVKDLVLTAVDSLSDAVEIMAASEEDLVRVPF